MLETDTSPHESRIADLVARRRPGWSLERPFYTDPDVFALDLEQVFRRNWLFAGHANRIPHPGDYFTHEFGSDSLIFIRGDDGEVHALFNTCRHRGSRICLEASGHARRLVCPYHQWVYDKDGALRTAPSMPSDFDQAEFGLLPVAVRVVEALIFVCFADDPPDFSSVEQGIRAHLAPYELERARICCTRTYHVRANWKLIEENFRECNHCPVGHPEYCHVMMPSGEERKRYPSFRAAQEERWARAGLSLLDIGFAPENGFHCSRYPLRPGFVSESLDGQPVAPLLGRLKDRDAGVLAIVMFPNFWFEASSDYVCSMRRTPISPTLCEVEASWLVHEDAVEGRDYDGERVTAFWRITGEQDWTLCENNQAGVNCSRYRPGPYALNESGPDTFVQWYLRQLSSSSSDPGDSMVAARPGSMARFMMRTLVLPSLTRPLTRPLGQGTIRRTAPGNRRRAGVAAVAYNDFTLDGLIQQFGLHVEEQPDLFASVAPRSVSTLLRQTLDENVSLALAIGTEKARSEFIIAPILSEVRRQLENRISLFSGTEFTVDVERGLRGVCDFLLSLSPLQLTIQAPVVAIVEAKNENFKQGINQCIAEMVAAQQFNRERDNPVRVIHGAVTTGNNWRFLRLEGAAVTVDQTEYYVKEVERIVGILVHIVNEAAPPLQSGDVRM